MSLSLTARLAAPAFFTSADGTNQVGTLYRNLPLVVLQLLHTIVCLVGTTAGPLVQVMTPLPWAPGHPGLLRTMYANITVARSG